jgi:GLPGLI family protein
MKKDIISTIVLCTFVYLLNGQSGTVLYNFTPKDLIKTREDTSLIAELRFNQQQSIFTFKQQPNAGNKVKTVRIGEENLAELIFQYVYWGDSIGHQVYRNSQNPKELYLRVIPGEHEKIMYVAITNRPILWKITDETKSIGKHLCLKAIGFDGCFRWTAWFATDINIPIGPLGINSLPGLILELNDDGGFYNFTCKSLNFTDLSNKLNILQPDWIQFCTDFSKFRTAVRTLDTQLEKVMLLSSPSDLNVQVVVDSISELWFNCWQ